MFNDERINLKIAKLYYHLLLIVLITTSIFTVLKGIYWNMSSIFSLNFFIFEISILLSGFVILLIDLLCFLPVSKTDEYYTYKRYKYYQVAGLVFLGCIIAGFILAGINNSLYFIILEPYKLAVPLLIICIIYANLYLKNNKIFFNYKFIENRVGYYKQVLLNLLNFLVGMIGLFIVVSISIFIVFNQSFNGSLYLVKINLFTSIIIFILLSCIYLFTSVVERLNYLDTTNKKPYLTSQIIIGCLYVIALIPLSFSALINVSLLDLNEQTIHLFLIRQNIFKVLDYGSTILFAYLIVNLIVSLNKKVKLIDGYIIVVIVSLIFGLLSYELSNIFVSYASDRLDNMYNVIIRFWSFTITISKLALLVWIMISISTNNNFSKKTNQILIGGIALCFVVRTLLYSTFNNINDVNKLILLTVGMINVISNGIYVLLINLNRNKFELDSPVISS